jgi:hypothetical protein
MVGKTYFPPKNGKTCQNKLKSESLNGVKSGFHEKKGKKGKIQLCLWGEISNLTSTSSIAFSDSL